jgi:membrane associated rhomboid family serine protease
MRALVATLKEKSKEIFLINFLVFTPMWAVFLINFYLLSNALNLWGIHPREFSLMGLVSVSTSWLLHANFQHIVGNSGVLFPLLMMVCLLEKRPAWHLAALIFSSGIFTWFLGMPNSVHVGASGLIFALFGYILASLFIGKNYLYLIPVGLVGYFYSQSIFQGLIPQKEISFAAHFGGFVGGFLIGSLAHKRIFNTKRV